MYIIIIYIYTFKIIIYYTIYYALIERMQCIKRKRERAKKNYIMHIKLMLIMYIITRYNQQLCSK